MMGNAKYDEKPETFGKIANAASQAACRATTFIIAAGVVIVWAVTGPIINYSDTWQLIINPFTTIVTFLIVFLIQKLPKPGQRRNSGQTG